MIKAGYTLEVTSWENDGDCYNTKRLDGLRAKDVSWRFKFLKRFSQDNDHQLTEESVNALILLVDPNRYNNEAITEELAYEVVNDVIYEMLGSTYESDYLRTFESAAVYYVEQDMLDLAAEFET